MLKHGSVMAQPCYIGPWHDHAMIMLQSCYDHAIRSSHMRLQCTGNITNEPAAEDVIVLYSVTK